MALPRMIPAIPRPVPSSAMHMPQCAPMNVPAARMRRPTVEAFATSRVKQMRTTTTWRFAHDDLLGVGGRWTHAPMTTFWVLEGAGHTLKGRHLRQVRNAVWWKTCLLD
ncbi:hypothetical protein VPH35_002225 [Triticum aestivum]